jgi:hypothetical protein
MKHHLIIGGVMAFVAFVTACTNMGSAASAVSAFEKLGGSSTVSSIAGGFVNSALKDPRLSGLIAGKSVDSTAASGKLSNQLCSMLGGGCQAPLTDSQITAGASKVSSNQSKAITDNFTSVLKSVVSDPSVRQLVTNAVGSKLPGIVGALL